MKTESQAAAQAKTEYAQALATIEQQYPELNPDSPSYNSKSLDWVAAKKNVYQERGQTPLNALQLAVADYVAALQQQQPITQTRQSRIQNSMEFNGSVGERLSLNFQNIDIRSILQVFTDLSGFHFRVDPQVSGGVNIRVNDQPWTQALMQMLQTNGLAIIKVPGGYFVFPSSLGDDVAYRRATQMGAEPAPRPNQVQSNPNIGKISQREAADTLCQTWPSACR